MSATTASLGDSHQYLGFYVAGEEFAIGILRVKEILEYGTVTKVPSTPDWIRGVINLRGSVVPVVDLAVKFGLAGSSVTRTTCIVIVELELDGERTDMGVMADAVTQVLELGPGAVEPPPPFGSRVRVDYLLGMGKLGERFVLLLDIDRVLSASDLLTVASAGVEAPADGVDELTGEAAAPGAAAATP